MFVLTEKRRCYFLFPRFLVHFAVLQSLYSHFCNFYFLESTPRPWPRNNKKREGPGSTPKNEPNRKNAPAQHGRGQYDRRPRPRGSGGYHVGGTQNTRYTFT